MATRATQTQRPMPNIMDYDSAADWQVAWRTWDQERAAATQRQARIHAARSNAARRGAATKRVSRGATTMTVVLHYTDRRGAGIMQTMHSAAQAQRRMEALRQQHVRAELRADGHVIGRVYYDDWPNSRWNYVFDPSVFQQKGGASDDLERAAEETEEIRQAGYRYEEGETGPAFTTSAEWIAFYQQQEEHERAGQAHAEAEAERAYFSCEECGQPLTEEEIADWQQNDPTAPRWTCNACARIPDNLPSRADH